jgi:hypothetical protein
LPTPEADAYRERKGRKTVERKVFSPLLIPEEASENFPGPVS